MNEEAQKVLAQLLQKAVSGIDSAVSFSQAQIPDIIQQLLVWKFVESVGYFVAAFVIMTCWCILARKLWARLAETEEKSRNRRRAAAEAYEAGEAWTRFRGAGSVTSGEYDTIMRSGPSDNQTLIVILGAMSALLTLVSLSYLNFTWLKIWLAPKLYLLEYAAALVK